MQLYPKLTQNIHKDRMWWHPKPSNKEVFEHNSLARSRVWNRHFRRHQNQKKNHLIIEGPTSANQTVEGRGDAFRFDGCRNRNLVPHRQPIECSPNLKGGTS
jgi:hypothetical protein